MFGRFPVRVRGVLRSGRLFEIDSTAHNLSTVGLYMGVPRSLEPGTRLFTVTRLPGGASLAARGIVVRVERGTHGLLGVGVRFSCSRLLPAERAMPSAGIATAAQTGNLVPAGSDS